MRMFLASLTAAAALLAGGAQAADIYQPGGYKEPPLLVPVNTWTGYYVGANGGFAWFAGTQTIDFADTLFNSSGTPAAVFTGRASAPSPSGGFGGGQWGYNWQRGWWVFGFESDIQGANISDSVRGTVAVESPIPSLTIGTRAFSAQSSLDWFATTRGRIGFAWDSALIYFTGGLAIGRTQDDVNFEASASSLGLNLGNIHFNDSQVRTGFVLGGGVEYKFNPAWSLKAEYQFIDLGSDSFCFGCGVENIQNLHERIRTSDIDHSWHTARIGINYHFAPEYTPLK